MMPEDDLARVQAWVEAQHASMPDDMRDQIKLELDVTDRSVTIVETRAPWRADFGPEWTRLQVAKMRYSERRRQWSLFWADRHGEFHEYDLIPPSRDVGDLLAEIEEDPTGIFGG